MIRKLLALLVLIPSLAFAGTVTGVIATPSGGVQKNLTISFTLNAPNTLAGSFAVSTSPALCYTDGSGNVVGLPTPLTAPVLSQNISSGTLAANTYFVKYTWSNASGESAPSPESTFTLTSTGTLIVSVPANPPPGATSWKIYISATTGTETLQSSVASPFAAYSQASSLSAGTALPSTNTSQCQLTFNDSYLSQPNYYTVSITTSTGQTINGISRTGKVYFSGGTNGTVNIANGLPDYNGQGVYPSPIMANPPANSQQTINGALNVAGQVSASSVSVSGAVTAASTNSVISACLQSGADVGAKINTAIVALPAAGGTIWVDRSCVGSFATGITVTKTAHIVFDVGAWTYTGSGDAINVSTAVRGMVIEGSGSGDVNGPTAATSITVTNTAANGANILNSPSGELKNIAFIGPGSGTGIGVHLTGNGFIVDNVLVASFGSDGWQVDGTRGNSNSITMRRAMAYTNGANGFNTFGANGNLITWELTDGQNNTTRNYLFNGVFNQVFIGAHTQMATDATGILFQASSANWGSIYSEPVNPFTAACVNFDSSSKNNNLNLLNCRVVTDAGGVANGNQWYFAASDAGTGTSGTGVQNVATPNVDATFNISRKITRAQQAGEETDEGVFLKSGSFFTGYTLKSKVAENFIYNTGAAGHSFRILNNCTATDISTCIPAFSLDGSGIPSYSGLQNYVVTAADVTITAGASLTAITGLSWTMPANTALKAPFSCHLLYSQATGAASDSFGIQDVTVAPTNLMAKGQAYISASTFTAGNLPALASTTATAIVTFTPSAATTVWNADLDGFIEQPSNASSSVVQIMAQFTTNNGTIKRGSFCRVF